MEVVGEGLKMLPHDRGITLKEAFTAALVFIALQFVVLAIGEVHSQPDAGIPAAWKQLIANLVAASGLILAGWSIARDRFLVAGLAGVGMVRLSGRSVFSCSFAGLLLGIVVVVLTQFFDSAREPSPLIGRVYFEGGISILLAWIFSVLVIAPIGEEMLCRGFILPALAKKIGALPAVIAAAFVFLLPHISQIGGYWVAAAGIFSLGVVAGIARVRTGSVVAAMVAHASYNVVPVAFVLWDQFLA